jgi:hypothetical protein
MGLNKKNNEKNNEKNNILFAGNNRLYLNPHSGLYN